ncbi:MAG: DUF4270 family protein [Pseudobacter sp.]|uniref:DUF4270 family protein n=1 Tax=Pseudobacter sp. TaxID=2045420 RepID=UPI003F7DCA29
MPDSFTRILTIDTVTPFLSTVVLDSFPTSGNGVLLVGRCVDPLMGPTLAQTFFQVGLPEAAQNATIPEDAVYDSLTLVAQPNKIWYGDTSKTLDFLAYEMTEAADYTYANRLWSTSSFSWAPAALGSVSRSLSPSRDSLYFKLADNKGAEMFQKIRDKDAAFQDAGSFLNYLKGITIKVNANNNGAVYSFKTDSSTVMRIHYHTTWPYYEKHTINFYPTRSEYQFNQLLTNRTGTPLEKKQDGQEEFYPDESNPVAYTQTGTGVMLKVKFPALQDIKTIGKTIQLLSAQLILKPVEGSFDQYTFPLPKTLFVAQTNATNIIGENLTDITGEATLAASPYIDDVYRLNTSYTFDITHYIAYLLTQNNSAEMGLYMLEESPGTTKLLNRAVIGNKQNPKWITQLKLTLLTTTE